MNPDSLLSLCQHQIINLCKQQPHLFDSLWETCQECWLPALEQPLVNYLCTLLDDGALSSRVACLSEAMVLGVLGSELVSCSELSLAEQVLKWFSIRCSVASLDFDHSYSSWFFTAHPSELLQKILSLLDLSAVNEAHVRFLYHFLHQKCAHTKPLPQRLLHDHAQYLKNPFREVTAGDVLMPRPLRRGQARKCLVSVRCATPRRGYTAHVQPPVLEALAELDELLGPTPKHLKGRHFPLKKTFTCTSTHRSLSHVPGVYEYGMCLVDGRFIIVAGGQKKFCELSKATVPWVWCIMPHCQHVTQLPNLKTPRCLFPLLARGSTLYAIGGARGDIILSDVEVLELRGRNSGSVEHRNSDGWSTGPRLPLPLHEHAGCVIDDRIYISGGYTEAPKDRAHQNCLLRLETAEEHKSWRHCAPMHYARSYHGMVCANDRLYVIGGAIWNQTFADVVDVPPCEVYEPKTDQWSVIASLPKPLSIVHPIVLGDSILVLAGFSFTRRSWVQNIQTFNCRKSQWSVSKRLNSEEDTVYYNPIVMEMPFWLLAEG